MSDTGTTPVTTGARPTPPSTVHKLAAEALGTATLVIIGCGTAWVTDASPLATGLAFGVTWLTLMYAFGRISGGHFNPAVSLGAALAGRISLKDAGLFAAAQVVGAIVGALLLAVVLLASDVGYEMGDWLGANGFGDHGGAELLGALLLEVLLTFLLVLLVLSITDARNEHAALAPLAVGLGLAALYFFAVPLTFASLNPARSIGPALFSGGDYIVQLWLFILAPLLGAAIAGFVHPLLFGRHGEPVPGSLGARRSAATPAGTGTTSGFEQQWNQQGAQHHGAAAGHQGAPQPAQTNEQPIIQDGWQWDPVAQQWIPAQQGYGGEAGTQVRPPQ